MRKQALLQRPTAVARTAPWLFWLSDDTVQGIAERPLFGALKLANCEITRPIDHRPALTAYPRVVANWFDVLLQFMFG